MKDKKKKQELTNEEIDENIFEMCNICSCLLYTSFSKSLIIVFLPMIFFPFSNSISSSSSQSPSSRYSSQFAILKTISSLFELLFFEPQEHKASGSVITSKMEKMIENTLYFMIILLSACMIPVSYTHLDVYKRQEQLPHMLLRSVHVLEYNQVP